MPNLEALCRLRATVAPAIDVGAVPAGQRQIFHVTGGEVEGERLSGRVVPGGADWLLVGADGVGRLDVRALIETHDGARVYVQYKGVMVVNEALASAIAEERPSEFGDAYFMTTPRFETGHADYAWLNRIVCVGQGRVLPGGVEYRIFEVRNDP